MTSSPYLPKGARLSALNFMNGPGKNPPRVSGCRGASGDGRNSSGRKQNKSQVAMNRLLMVYLVTPMPLLGKTTNNLLTYAVLDY